MNSLITGAVDLRRQSMSSTQLANHPAVNARDAGLSSVKAVTSNLTGRTCTNVATEAIDLLARRIMVATGTRICPSRKYLDALAAIVADLLTSASHDPYRPCYRPTASGAFTGGHVGYHPFTRVLADLVREGLVIVHPGNGPCGGMPGVTTRIYPTADLILRLEALGIMPANRLTHFRHRRAAGAAAPAVPIRLVAGSTRNAKYVKVPGKPLPIDMNDPVVAALAKPIIEINSFLSEQTFSMAEQVSLFRSFNAGDDPSHNWLVGGRLNCYGGGFQMMNKEERALILINETATVEVDASACHLTIAYGLLQEKLPAYSDLYAVKGIPRSVVKAFINYLLGKGSVPTQWHPDHRSKYRKEFKSNLSIDYPIRVIAPIILASHPILRKAINAGLSWGSLQNADSDIIVDTVHTLAFQHGICSLPVHDSLIFPVFAKQIAIEVFSRAFENRVGVTPYIK